MSLILYDDGTVREIDPSEPPAIGSGNLTFEAYITVNFKPHDPIGPMIVKAADIEEAFQTAFNQYKSCFKSGKQTLVTVYNGPIENPVEMIQKYI
jgi:adenine-specific DNA methylase